MTQPSKHIVPMKQMAERKGYVNSESVKMMSFYTITACIAISVIMSILAIWDFANDDVLWRTVSTCAVIGFGCIVFTVVNQIFGVKLS